MYTVSTPSHRIGFNKWINKLKQSYRSLAKWNSELKLTNGLKIFQSESQLLYTPSLEEKWPWHFFFELWAHLQFVGYLPTHLREGDIGSGYCEDSYLKSTSPEYDPLFQQQLEFSSSLCLKILEAEKLRYSMKKMPMGFSSYKYFKILWIF